MCARQGRIENLYRIPLHRPKAGRLEDTTEKRPKGVSERASSSGSGAQSGIFPVIRDPNEEDSKLKLCWRDSMVPRPLRGWSLEEAMVGLGKLLCFPQGKNSSCMPQRMADLGRTDHARSSV